jgi:hypothetical protein
VGPARTVIDVLKPQLEREAIRPGRQKLLEAVQDFAG